ncbi:hypothetical protein [Sinobaca sp. H24]|uniref:hypothetical protein n=1 Tax=Sinobaca sp. H24 TaxID=2923376 RepID=UPI002079DAF9|nr:hypothetical protein [Sinobaca sp. H24]
MKWMTSAALICFLSLPLSAQAAPSDQGGFFSSFMNQILPSSEPETEAGETEDKWAEAQLEVEEEENQTEEERLHAFDETWASFPSSDGAPALMTPLNLFTAASSFTNRYAEPEAPEAAEAGLPSHEEEEQTNSTWDSFDDQWDDFGRSFDAARQEKDTAEKEPAVFQETEDMN